MTGFLTRYSKGFWSIDRQADVQMAQLSPAQGPTLRAAEKEAYTGERVVASKRFTSLLVVM